MKKFFGLLVVFLLVAGVLSGCGTQQADQKEEASASQQEDKQEVTVQVEVSKSNGEEMLADKEVSVPEGTTLMEVMKENFEVKESEGFINSIEGIEGNQEEKMAWMFTINGEEAMVGANEYEVEQGDEIVFDYHSWE
ncbi:DUF4430 domain-containing protein [Halobacillus sp. BBL2006]|uniref:DUF4430 domain-containing protein n=1 Tax=Halobacillus sp. BBL2006 TaxID=1543706 RepID=UPI00054406B6|nr:DUF4430 domain-containing protein [Halobacillus sp. BBL2006]KHE71393.1 hypothetical protein LD39_10035 [Halobacillus sp. BBL2006]